MLTPITETNFNKYIDFAFDLSLDQTKSGYPTYTDGIKTKEDFIASAKKAFSSSSGGILLFAYGEKAEGWIQYYYLTEDKYLSTNVFCVNTHTEAALKDFISFSEKGFKGYDLYFGFPESNVKAVNYLSQNGFECIEDDFNNSFFFEEYTPLPQSKAVKKITRENFEDFRRLMDAQTDDTTYWNSDRIFEALDKWSIYGFYRNGELLGAVYFTDNGLMLEIFGFVFSSPYPFDEGIYRDLLITVLNAGKKDGAKYMTYFCEKEYQPIVSELGFKYIGEYVCYIKRL